MRTSVLVVDDSALMRSIISKMLGEDPDIEVVGTARNGLDALKWVERLQPDVITMDVEMPELNGIEAVKRIMSQFPRPIIMVSTLTAQGADATIEALNAGAFDFIAKPGVRTNDMTSVAHELVEKVKIASKSSIRPFTSEKRTPVPARVVRDSPRPASDVSQLVAIGVSTGGPQALERVLTSLPHSLPSPVLVVQHMPPHFTKSLATRLNDICEIEVVEATHHQELRNGVAYIAPGGFHMQVVRRVQQFRIALNEESKRNEHRPSVDVLFESLLHFSLPKCFVLMTGMGSDGAVGMQKGKETGATTIAQSKETCVVYGMPKSAIELGCVDHVLPLEMIGRKIVQVVTDSRK